MSHDFNTAERQRDFDVIPDGTIATLHITVRPGNAGDAGWLRRSKDGKSEALDLELTVVDGDYAKRKIWTLLTISGITDGHAEAGRISGQRLRGILESARGILPNDKSDAAAQARRVESFGDFDGLRFIGRMSSRRRTTTRQKTRWIRPSRLTAKTGIRSSRCRGRPKPHLPPARSRRLPRPPRSRRLRGQNGGAEQTRGRMATAGDRRCHRRCA
jgi:hypothetical protein